MLHKLLVTGAAIAAIAAAFAVAPQPVEAGSCTVVVAEGRGASEAKASARAQKHLTFKINRWARKGGYKSVRTGKSATVCTQKVAFAKCTASAKVCG